MRGDAYYVATSVYGHFKERGSRYGQGFNGSSAARDRRASHRGYRR